jgi:hypothetical protein
MLAKANNDLANIKTTFLMNLLSEKKYGTPSRNFERKNVLCEKGDEITRFDGTIYVLALVSLVNEHPLL